MSRDEKTIQETVGKIEKKGGRCSYALAELTDPQQGKEAVEKAISKFGTVHGSGK